jgi:hypothetical protein
MSQRLSDGARGGAHPADGEVVSAKNPTVAQHLEDLDHPRKHDIERVRSALLASDAELGERIKWNAPSIGYDGQDRVTFRLQPGSRFELVLHRGVRKRDDPFQFHDPDGLLTWATSDRGTTTVPEGISGKEERRLLDLVRRWLLATR